MFCKVTVILVLTAVALCQQSKLPCGFSCSRQSQNTLKIGGSVVKANYYGAGCREYCASAALAAGLSTEFASQYPTLDDLECVCCFLNKGRGCPTY